MNFRFKTLQGRLFFLLLIPVFFIILCAGAISYFHTRDAVIRQWEDSARLKLERAAHYTQMRVLRPLESMSVLFRISQDKGLPLSQDTLISYIMSLNGVHGVTLLDTIPEHGSPIELSELIMDGKSALFDQYQFQMSLISALTFDSALGNDFVDFLLEYVDGQGRKQAIGIKISFDYLLKDILNQGWWQSRMACVVEEDGRYLAHTNMEMRQRRVLGGSGDPLELAILKAMSGSDFGTLTTGGRSPDWVAGFHKMERLPWAIILFVPGDVLLAPLVTYRNQVIFGGLVLVVLVLFLIRRQVGGMVDQILSLSENSRRVARGEYPDPLPSAGADELGQLVDHYNGMVEGLKERDFIRDSFGRYVDPEFAKALLVRPTAGALGGERRRVVVMMSDIREFTRMSEAMDPELIIHVLNRYFSLMIETIQSHGGIIVDFFGDAVLVFFDPLCNAPEKSQGQSSGTRSDDLLTKLPDTSLEAAVVTCVQCAHEMQIRMENFNRERADLTPALPDLGMGIGIDAGPVVVGNIGSKSRAKYGIVGSCVNVTSRIQAKARAGEILVSPAVYSHVKDRVRVGRTFTAELKGVEKSVQLRSILPTAD